MIMNFFEFDSVLSLMLFAMFTTLCNFKKILSVLNFLIIKKSLDFIGCYAGNESSRGTAFVPALSGGEEVTVYTICCGWRFEGLHNCRKGKAIWAISVSTQRGMCQSHHKEDGDKLEVFG